MAEVSHALIDCHELYVVSAVLFAQSELRGGGEGLPDTFHSEVGTICEGYQSINRVCEEGESG